MLRMEPAPIETANGHQRAPMVQWTHGLINRLAVIIDVVTLTLGAVLSWSLFGHAAGTVSAGQAFPIGLISAVCAVVTLRRHGAYRVERYQHVDETLRDIVLLIAMSALCCSLALILWMPINELQRWLLRCLALQAVLMLLARLLCGIGVKLIEHLGLLRRTVAVVGTSHLANAMAERLGAPTMSRHYSLIGVYDDGQSARPTTSTGHAAMLSLTDLARYAEGHRVDLIMLCPHHPYGGGGGLQRVIDQVQWISADVVIPIESGQPLPDGRAITLAGGERVSQVMHRPFKGSLGLLKLTEDYVVASIGLLLTAPLLLFVALAIRLDSPGPIMFRQQRVGFNNKIFMIYKFRTMTVDPEDDGRIGTNVPNHPRITRVGGILRRLSIDELPQLINVLAGDMSIVGPRPYVRNMLLGDMSIDDSIRQFAARHRIKPGLTGWAQVHGLRGNALRSIEGARRSVELDIEYISNWSLWFDFRIMIQTIGVLAGQNVF
jgi:exopolysaccharide biosynthesis polyprenyl glycosylphosphotransferase